MRGWYGWGGGKKIRTKFWILFLKWVELVERYGPKIFWVPVLILMNFGQNLFFGNGEKLLKN